MGARPDLIAAQTGFARALRARGVRADVSRAVVFAASLAHLDPTRPADLYWAGRATLCATPDDTPAYDEVFAQWFGRPAPSPADPALPDAPAPDPHTEPTARESGVVNTRVGTSEHASARESPTSSARVPDVVHASPRPGARESSGSAAASPGGADEAGGAGDQLGLAASAAEVLRHRDVAEFDDAERAELFRALALLRPRVRPRPTRRRRPGGRGRPDLRRTVRAMLRDGGEPGALLRSRRRHKPRRLVVLVDVSGSMSPYADLLLRFAHAALRVAPATTEVFTVGTRTTRLTPWLRLRDPGEAVRAAGRAIPDWSGGTRLGESLRAFLDLWGHRGVARRAVVVIGSDGWERGDVTLLGEQMRRLSRLAHRVVWVNPHRERAGFAPTAGGMAAALPYVDDLVGGHSAATLDRLVEVIRDA